MDKIIVNDIEVNTVIGTLEHERNIKQKLLVNIEMSLHLRLAGETDDLKYSVNYAEIEKRIIDLGSESNFFLIERFAESVAELCLEYKRVLHVKVRVDKPIALKNSRSVAVVLQRSGD